LEQKTELRWESQKAVKMELQKEKKWDGMKVCMMVA
jgi:hypothetical protein